MQSGSYTQHFDVGSATMFTFQNANAGQRYCFAVSAYLYSSYVEGPNSQEICGYSNAPPTLENPGNRTSVVGQNVTLQLVGSDPQSQPLTYSATGLPPGLSVMASTGFISGAGTTAGSYNVTVRAFDGTLTTSQTFTWVMSTTSSGGSGGGSGGSGGGSTLAVSISAPTTDATLTTPESSITLSGTATAPNGLRQITWWSDRGQSGYPTVATNWSIANIALASGTTVFTVMVSDWSGNTASDTLTVTRGTAPPPSGGGGGGSSALAVSISAPTTDATYTTSSSSITLSGTATANQGLRQITWWNDRGQSGYPTVATNWSIANIQLASGTTVFTVLVTDWSGNTASDTLTVTQGSAPSGGGGGGGSSALAVSISAPTTDATYTTSASSITLSGTATANQGLRQITWWNDRGQSGYPSVATSWSTSNIQLASGTTVFTVMVTDWSGATASDTLTVTQGSAPSGGGGGGGSSALSVSISAPTTAATFTTSATSITLSGSATANQGLRQITWWNDRGQSGYPTVATNWSISNIALGSGTTVFTVMVMDWSGATASDTLTVTRGTTTTSTSPAPSTSSVGFMIEPRNSDPRSTRLVWWNAPWSGVDVYRNGMRLTYTENDGYYTDAIWSGGTYTYQICAAGSTTTCSSIATAYF